MNIGIVTSFIIGGLLLLSILQLNTRVLENSSQSTLNLMAKNNVETVSEILSHDLRKVGYGTSGGAISTANTQRFAFVADIDNDGAIDNLIWEYDTTAAIAETENPHDHPLYRIVNSDTSVLKTATTSFTFTYYDSLDAVTTTPGDVRHLKIEVACESPAPYGNDYPESTWERRFSPVNL